MSSPSPDDGAPASANSDRAEVAGASRDAAEEPARPPPRKRRRIVISCTECHRRKQKCDRQLPCTNCISRNKQGACRYETGAPTARKHAATTTTTTTTTTTKPTTSPADSNDTPQDDAVPNNNISSTSTSSSSTSKRNPSTPRHAPTFGYTACPSNTLTFLSRIDSAHPDDGPLLASTLGGGSTSAAADADPDSLASVGRRYKALVRQLPSRRHVAALAATYFRCLNWQYYALDRATFDAQLDAWYRVPFATLSRPDLLSPEMRAFPALLFQMLAVALLVVDEDEAEEELAEGLKYAGGMRFEDLAGEYSDAGMELLALLGKREMGVNTVLAGWLRAGALKYLGFVTESWHAVGAAIRDAQEIGLHHDGLDPRPGTGAGAGGEQQSAAEAVLENQWEIQRRRRVWMTLVTWDVHMASVLGRPTTTDSAAAGTATASLPVDAPEPRDRSRTPVLPRGEDDPPTPLTGAIWAHRIMTPLREIIELEKEGPCPRDAFGRVDRLHAQLLDLGAAMPACLRLENPDTRFDGLPECYFLPTARVILPQLLSFALMALHRPYVFTRPRSRTEALKASLGMLHSQRLHFMALPPHMYKTFSLFFGTFDAIVLMASLYILFPKEHPELVPQALQHFQWAVERFEAMAARNNSLARAALGVLHAIYVRLKKSLGLTAQSVRAILAASGTSSAACPSNNDGGGGASSSRSAAPHGITGRLFPFWCTASFGCSPSAGSSSSTNMPAQDELSSPQQQAHNTSCHHPANNPHRDGGFSSGTGSTGTLTAGATPDFFSDTNTNTSSGCGGGGGFDWHPPSDFDWASLQPIYATSDLVYNDLAGTWAPGPPFAAPAQGGAGAGTDGNEGNVDDLAAMLEQGHQQHRHLLHGLGGFCTTAEAAAAVARAEEAAARMQPGVCQFEGCFGDDSVWSLLNHYAPF